METESNSFVEAAPSVTEDNLAFDKSSKNFFRKHSESDMWGEIPRDCVKTHLVNCGYSKKASAGGNSPVENRINEIVDKKAVDYAGELAGHDSGLLKVGKNTYLVTSGADLLKPVEGEWKTVEKLITNMFGDGDQRTYFYSWLKVALCARQAKVIIPGQAVVLAGKAGTGKSLLQLRVITPLLGGRSCKPMQFITGKTTFNKDLTRAEHWMMEDEHASTDIKSRRALGTAIKDITVNTMHRLHAKGRDAVMSAPLFVRLSISLNDEAENMLVLPPLDDSVLGKLMLFKVQSAFTEKVGDTEKRKEFERQLEVEMPHFAWWLMNVWEIPEAIRDTRFGVQAYANPELLDVFDENAPELVMLELMDRAWFSGDSSQKLVRGKATDLQSQLVAAESLVSFEARRLLYQNNTCGTYLGRLAVRRPDRVLKHGCGNGNPHTWTVLPPSTA
jgi:hypothetical protein